MNASNRRSLWVVLAALICILLVGALIVSAQSTPPSIPIGENQSSSLTNASSTSLFSVTVTTPQNINVLILATSPGFAPAFRVFDPNNAVIFDAANVTGQNIVQNQVTLASPGIYIIEVRSANNSAGQFTISIQPGAPFIAPIPLELDQPVTATVDPQNTQKVYSFTALTTDALFVEANSTSPTSGPVIRLVNADAGDTFGLANAHLTLARFRMPIGTTNYLLYVTHSGSTFPESVIICLWPEHGQPCSGSGSAGTVPQNPTSEATQNGSNGSNGACTCEFTLTGSQTINIRAVPGLNAQIVGQLPPNTPAQVIGESPNHLWIEINYNGVIGWVAAAVVTINNSCLGIPVVTPTPPPGQPTATATRGRGGLPTPHIDRPTPTATLGRLHIPTRIPGNPTNTLPPPPPVNPTNTPPPPPQATATQPGPCISVAACPPTSTPRFQVQPSLVFNPPKPTPTHVVIK